MGTDVPDDIHGTSLPRVSRWLRHVANLTPELTPGLGPSHSRGERLCHAKAVSPKRVARRRTTRRVQFNPLPCRAEWKPAL